MQPVCFCPTTLSVKHEVLLNIAVRDGSGVMRRQIEKPWERVKTRGRSRGDDW